jgi:hypothetical protein
MLPNTAAKTVGAPVHEFLEQPLLAVAVRDVSGAHISKLFQQL